MDVQALIDEFNAENPPVENTDTVSDDSAIGSEGSESVENTVEDTDPVQTDETSSEQPSEVVPSEELEVDGVEEENPLQDLSDQVKTKQTPEQNRAFAEMRRKLQEAEKAKKFLEKVAQESGVSLDQLMQSYEQRRIEAEAQKAGVPVEVYQRLQSLEQSNMELKKQAQLNRFFGQVEIVKQKYDLKDDEVDRTFKYIGSKGLFDPETKVPVIDFEDAYFLANRDTLIQRKAEESRQQMLAEKKKRQQQAAIPHKGVSANTTPQVEEWTDEAIDKQLKKMGLDHLLR